MIPECRCDGHDLGVMGAVWRSQQAQDGTHKFLWALHDQKTIESVIIPAALQEKDMQGKLATGLEEDESVD